MRWPCLISLLVSISLLTADEPKKKPPPRDKAAALKLFVEEFVPITPGKGRFPASFRMGSADGPKSEQPTHMVKMARPFGMARFEVTQELHLAVTGKDPARWKGPRNSVEMVSWDEASNFCRKATAELRKRKLIGTAEEIRLPSEAEWEYCCRAGTTGDFSFKDPKQIREYCWFKDNSPGNDPPVGSKKPNPWGLHELHGYVWEWCADSWHPDYKGAPTDGSAWSDQKAKEHVVRGGAFNSPAERCRSAARDHRATGFRSDALGFRCVRAKVK
jgi:formylglycine-generating enzyme required for sulfatase activity